MDVNAGISALPKWAAVAVATRAFIRSWPSLFLNPISDKSTSTIIELIDVAAMTASEAAMLEKLRSSALFTALQGELRNFEGPLQTNPSSIFEADLRTQLVWAADRLLQAVQNDSQSEWSSAVGDVISFCKGVAGKNPISRMCWAPIFPQPSACLSSPGHCRSFSRWLSYRSRLRPRSGKT